MFECCECKVCGCNGEIVVGQAGQGRAMLLEMEGSSLERGGDDCSAGPLNSKQRRSGGGSGGKERW